MGFSDWLAVSPSFAGIVFTDMTFQDSVKATLGTGGDADLYYDGTNVILTPDVAGSGYINLDGDTVVSNGHGVVFGHTAQETVSAGDAATDMVPEVQILGTAGADSSLLLAAFSTTATIAAAPSVVLVKGGNATIGSHTVVTDDEVLGSLVFGADDGTDLESIAAWIKGEVDGTPGTGDMPGRLVFGTSADGAEVPTERMRIDAAGKIFIGDTANADLTTGITLNQGAADDEIMAFKSSDAGHPMTGSAEADTYGKITKASGGNGWLMLWGLSDGSGDSCDFYALSGSAASTAKTTSASALYVFYTGITDGGTGVTNPGSNQNLVAIWSGNDTARFILDVEGSGHSDVEWTTYDREDDLSLMDAVEDAMLGKRLTPGRFGDNSLYYDREYLESTQIIGKDSWHVEHRADGRVQNRAMVNWTRLAMLHHGALLQVGDRLKDVEARAELAEAKLLALGAA